jgi:hypothetical protein
VHTNAVSALVNRVSERGLSTFKLMCYTEEEFISEDLGRWGLFPQRPASPAACQRGFGQSLQGKAFRLGVKVAIHDEASENVISMNKALKLVLEVRQL